MSITYERLRTKPIVFQRITGTSVKEFECIAEKLAPHWNKFLKSKKLDGRPSKLKTMRDHLLLLLMYYRTYITYDFLGLLFGLSKSNAWYALKKIEPLVIKTVAIKKDRTLKSDELAALIVDVTEQPINRPKKKQKQFYSGKKNAIL